MDEYHTRPKQNRPWPSSPSCLRLCHRGCCQGTGTPPLSRQFQRAALPAQKEHPVSATSFASATWRNAGTRGNSCWRPIDLRNAGTRLEDLRLQWVSLGSICGQLSPTLCLSVLPKLGIVILRCKPYEADNEPVLQLGGP